MKKASTMQVVDTFPAGTLSGAPKHRAMQLIEEYEKTNRNFYGGAIGFMDFEGNFNHYDSNFPEKSPITLSSRSRNCCRIRRRKRNGRSV
jgi:hypothetical protein